MRIYDHHQLDQLTGHARDSQRLRRNLNIHPGDDYCCHRLFNAIEPASYIRPHRHLDPAKDETFVIIRGQLGVISFDDSGTVRGKTLLSLQDVIAVDVPHGTFHSAVSLAPGTIFLEVKGGPYRPLEAHEAAPWAPEEASPTAPDYLHFLRALFAR